MSKPKPGEPTFVLRAQDKLAPQILELYALEATIKGVNPAKVQSVRDMAEKMRYWQRINGCKVPD